MVQAIYRYKFGELDLETDVQPKGVSERHPIWQFRRDNWALHMMPSHIVRLAGTMYTANQIGSKHLAMDFVAK